MWWYFLHFILSTIDCFPYLQPGNPLAETLRNLSRLSPPSVSSERERCRACEEKADTRPCFRICPPDNYIIGAPGHEGRESSVSRQFGQTPLIGRPAACQAALLPFSDHFWGKFLGKHRKRLERASINYRGAKMSHFQHRQYHQHLLQYASPAKKM